MFCKCLACEHDEWSSKPVVVKDLQMKEPSIVLVYDVESTGPKRGFKGSDKIGSIRVLHNLLHMSYIWCICICICILYLVNSAF